MLSDYPPIDKEDSLTTDDIKTLQKKFRKERYGTITGGVVIFAFIALMDFPLDIYHWTLAFVIWIGIAVANFLRHRNLIERGKKRVIRGVIAQRYKSKTEDAFDLVIFINGNRLEIPLQVYKEYFTGDFAEFHFLNKILLQHRLLKRGKKEYV